MMTHYLNYKEILFAATCALATHVALISLALQP
ncbi:hypothetical protein FHS49_001943 [Sphingobium boeckii]|uniref:Uncharacterized protein n=1 Tax=Sphingobium boeckii TaxID=1082345 RepID=A0A7W9AHS2_9SPHN|nr:hypothetical protein [Sphingobium boeckii]